MHVDQLGVECAKVAPQSPYGRRVVAREWQCPCFNVYCLQFVLERHRLAQEPCRQCEPLRVEAERELAHPAGSCRASRLRCPKEMQDTYLAANWREMGDRQSSL